MVKQLEARHSKSFKYLYLPGLAPPPEYHCPQLCCFLV